MCVFSKASDTVWQIKNAIMCNTFILFRYEGGVYMKLSMVRIALLLLVVVIFSCVGVPSQEHARFINFATDKQYVIGNTKNGTTYYLRANPESQNKITVALILKVGSVLEKDTQLGLAHFVEHMGFNGSEKFPRNEIIQTLERHGVHFGKDLNASTSFDKTVFHITIPSEKKELLPLLLDIAEEWAHNLSYDQEEIEKEKGVVQEEIRGDLQPFAHARKQALEFFLDGSRYAKRNPGGTMEIIGSASRQVIKSFYDTWYKPNLMALAVIGDIDTRKVEKEVLERFQYEDTFVERSEYSLPMNTSDEVEFASFPVDEKTELPLGYIGQFRPAYDNYREAIIDEVIKLLVNRRFRTLVQKSTAVNKAYIHTLFLGTQGAYLRRLIFRPHKNKSYAAFQEVVAEIERLRQFGFDEDEYKTLIKVVIENLENTQKSNYGFLRSIVRNFVHSEILAENKKIISIFKNLLQDRFITRGEINARLAHFGKQSKMRMALIYPVGETIPDAQKFIEFYKNASTLPLTARKPIKKIKTLLSDDAKKQIKRGTIVEQSYNKGSSIHRFVLENGVTVYFKQLRTAKKDIVILGSAENSRHMKYGTTKSDVLTAEFARRSLPYVKMGGHDEEQIRQYLRDNFIRVRFNYGHKRNIAVSTMAHRSESVFEFLHVLFRDIAYDLTKTELLTQAVESAIHKLLASDGANLGIRFDGAMFPRNPFELNMDDYAIAHFNPRKAFDIVHEAFDNIADYTFYIAGNVNVHTVKKLLSTYVASVPRNVEEQDTRLRYDIGFTKKDKTILEYERGREQAKVLYGWGRRLPVDTSYNVGVYERVAQGFVANALAIAMRETIREEESKVYGIRPKFHFSSVPETMGYLTVRFNSASDTSLEIIEKSQGLIKQFAKGKLDNQVDIIQRARLGMLASYEELPTKAYDYAHAMRDIDDLDGLGDMTKTVDAFYKDILTRITSADVPTYLSEFLEYAKYVQLTQKPKE